MERYRWLKNQVRTMSKYTDRINVCYPCPQSERKILGLFCKVCGCNMKLKARMDGEKCPLGKWKEQFCGRQVSHLLPPPPLSQQVSPYFKGLRGVSWAILPTNYAPTSVLRESSAICPTRIQLIRFSIPLLPFSFVSLTILTPILPIQRQAP